MDQRSVRARNKCWEWCARYAPLEVIGTATALVGALVTHHLTGNIILAAFVGSLSETLGYYALASLREWRRLARHAEQASTLGTFWRTARNLIVEFGPAELLDTLVVRPALMVAGPSLVGSVGAGILVGKLAADVVFYSVTIATYELSKRALGRPAPRRADARSAL